MKKNYQTKAASAATDKLVMSESVSVAMAELTDMVKEGHWPWPWGPGSRSCRR